MMVLLLMKDGIDSDDGDGDDDDDNDVVEAAVSVMTSMMVTCRCCYTFLLLDYSAVCLWNLEG